MPARDPRPAAGDRPERSADRRSRRASQAEPPDGPPLRRRTAEEPRRRTAEAPDRVDARPARRPAPHSRTTGLTARRAATLAAAQVGDLTGRTPEGITSLDRGEEGWEVGVEVLETRRVPDSNDILAVYRVVLDNDGDLVSFRRERRYLRGRTEEDS
ncbi:gas vesicle protein GvpO [Kitasatospora sp. NPDC051914]|uniref:gas vesicle protein GvpO n=1 Tax=Kitasatospora sp. NPDC051914 TaxID=3154945 RepID=UPI0034294B70